MIELTETLVFAVMVVLGLIFGLVAITTVAILLILKHLRKTAEAEAKAEKEAARIEAERQRLDSFNEIVHKAQLADLARDCIAGKETAWVDTPTDAKPADKL